MRKWEGLVVKILLWWMGVMAVGIFIVWVASIFWMKSTVR